ncbi:MAG: hypothetical protein JO129_03765 [Candidatus Dependentiae bacterium]|nr:hypothetical protein [Candidatus Dependentiae bacterium]
MNRQRGYILLMTFSILALCTALISVFMIKGITHKKFATALLDQDQINQLGLSMPALAQGFLGFSATEMKEIKEAQKKSENQQASENQPVDEAMSFGKLILKKMLPVVNKTQKFNLKEVEKDFLVDVSLTFFCESGKININGLYDLVNQRFYDEGIPEKDQKVFATWLFDKIAAITEKPSLLQPFVEHVKQRKVPFNDVTELLAIKEFAACFSQAVFYEPEQQSITSDKKTRKLFLTDIFTVASENDTIQPWLLSPSVCALLDIVQKGDKNEEPEKKEDIKVDLSSFKQQADWQKDWDTGLKPLYDISYDKIPEPVRSMLAKQFSATVFSILITVVRQTAESENNIEARIFAILKERKLQDDSIIYDVIRIYQV